MKRDGTSGRDSFRLAVSVSCLLLASALLLRLRHGGGPWFSRPATVLDHVGPLEHPVRPALLLLPRIAPLLPPGASVTCFRPRDGASWDDGETFLAAASILTRNRVRPPLSTRSDDRPQFAIALGGPFVDPAYREISSVTGAHLYELAR